MNVSNVRWTSPTAGFDQLGQTPHPKSISNQNIAD
jgi:hypothetical protein